MILQDQLYLLTIVYIALTEMLMLLNELKDSNQRQQQNMHNIDRAL